MTVSINDIASVWLRDRATGFFATSIDPLSYTASPLSTITLPASEALAVLDRSPDGTRWDIQYTSAELEAIRQLAVTAQRIANLIGHDSPVIRTLATAAATLSGSRTLGCDVCHGEYNETVASFAHREWLHTFCMCGDVTLSVCPWCRGKRPGDIVRNFEAAGRPPINQGRIGTNAHASGAHS